MHEVNDLDGEHFSRYDFLKDPVLVSRVCRRMIWNSRGDFGAEVIGPSGSGSAA